MQDGGFRSVVFTLVCRKLGVISVEEGNGKSLGPKPLLSLPYFTVSYTVTEDLYIYV
jgi:hypothetical protein